MAARIRETEFFATRTLPVRDEGDYVTIEFCRDGAILRVQLTRTAHDKLARDIAMGQPDRIRH